MIVNCNKCHNKCNDSHGYLSFGFHLYPKCPFCPGECGSDSHLADKFEWESINISADNIKEINENIEKEEASLKEENINIEKLTKCLKNYQNNIEKDVDLFRKIVNQMDNDSFSFVDDKFTPMKGDGTTESFILANINDIKHIINVLN